MKIFLITSIVAMIGAGIYGSFDLACDINRGTLIQYEKENASDVKSFVVSEKKLSVLTHSLKIEAKKKEKISLSPMPDLKMEYFSRGEPPHYLLEQELALLNTANNDSSIVNSTPIVKEIKSDSEKVEAILPEERKFSPRLFSRGRPRPYPKENVVAEADSLKN